jgi:predicted dehydrogenase
MAAVGNIDVVAACDINPEALVNFERVWGTHWPSARLFTDVDEMLDTPLDLVAVVTPDHLHAVMLHRCLDAGIPMIFTEKPFTTDLAVADELLDRIEDTQTTVIVNHTWRWRPDVVEAKAMVTRGDLGPLSQVSIEAGGPRAMLFRNLSHFIDLAIHLMDADPVWVTAELETGNEDYGLVYRGEGGADPDLDPGAWAIIGFPEGKRAYVSGLKSSPADVSIQVQCLQGRITIDPLGSRVVSNSRGNDGTPASVSGPAIWPLKPRFTTTGMAAGLADLILAREQGREPSGSARSARQTVAVIDAILRSQASGRRVNVTQHGSAARRPE